MKKNKGVKEMSGKGKAIFISLLSLILVGAILSGCGGENQNQGQSGTKETKTVINFWHYWDGNNGNAMKEIVDQFNAANSDIEVKAVFIPGGELMTKLQSVMGSNNSPHVVAADITGMAKLRSTGKLLALDDYLKDNGVDVDQFYPALLEYGKQDGKIYSLPVSTNNLALFYNKDLFKQAGLDPNQPPVTWDELKKDAEIIQSKIPGIYGFEFYTQVGDNGEGLTWQLQPFLWQTGADFIKDGKAAFNNPQGLQALTFITDLIKNKLAPVGSWDDFSKGKAAMVIDGSWMVGIWKESLNFDFGTAMIPIPENGTNATNMGGEQVFVLNKSNQENAAAVRFISYLVQKETQIEWDKKTGFMPIRKDVAEDKAYTDWVNSTEPRLLPFVQQQQYAHARPSIIEYPDTSLAFAKEIEKAYYQKVSPGEALKNAEKAVNDLLK